MDPNLDFQISALVKELARKDAEARALKRDLVLYEKSEVLNLHEDERPAPTAGGQSARRNIPAEDEARLVEARNLLKVAGDEHDLAMQEKDIASQRFATAAAHTDMLRAELELMYEAANWRPGDAYGYIDKISVGNEVEGWRREIDELLSLKETELKQIHLQSLQMKVNAKKLQGSASNEKDLFDANTELRVVEEQIRSAKEEILSLTRVFKRKEKMLNDLEAHDDTADLKAIEAAKRLNAVKMAKHRESMRQNDVMIRNQAVKIQKYEDRLELIGEAVRGDDGEEVERVDADVLTDVQREIKALKLTAANQGNDLETLDQKVQAADGCMRTLTRQKAVTEKRITKGTQDHKAKKRKLTEQSHVAQTNADRMIAEQKRRNEDTKIQAAQSEKAAERSEQRQRKLDDERAKREEAEEAQKRQRREDIAAKQKERERRERKQKQAESEEVSKEKEEEKEEAANAEEAPAKEQEAEGDAPAQGTEEEAGASEETKDEEEPKSDGKAADEEKVDNVAAEDEAPAQVDDTKEDDSSAPATEEKTAAEADATKEEQTTPPATEEKKGEGETQDA